MLHIHNSNNAELDIIKCLGKSADAISINENSLNNEEESLRKATLISIYIS
jgi:hypothetical protein